MAATCRGCGKEIVWAETNHGKKVPLDPRAIVYSVVREMGKMVAVRPTGGVSGETFMVSHFNTCPKANDFSGSNRKEPNEASIGSSPGEPDGLSERYP